MALKNGLSFRATGMETAALHRLQDIQVALLHLAPRHVEVGGDVVDVQLDAARAGLLHHARRVHPAFVGDAVETADDGDVDRLRRLLQQLQVLLRPGFVILVIRKVAERLGKALGSRGDQVLDGGILAFDLLLEQREHHYRRGSRVLHALDVVELLGQGGGGCDDGVLERQSHVGGAEIHTVILCYGWGFRSRPSRPGSAHRRSRGAPCPGSRRVRTAATSG